MALALVLRKAPAGSALPLGMTVTLRAGDVVGRDPEATVVLRDASVSRHHLRVDADADGALRLTNASRDNGVFVDGVAIAPGQHQGLPPNLRRLQIGGLLFERTVDERTEPVTAPMSLSTQAGGQAPGLPSWVILSDADACTVRLGGRLLDVSPNAARALRALARRPGAVVHEWDIQSEVGARCNVAQLMSSLRRALKAAVADGLLPEDAVRAAILAVRSGADAGEVAQLSGAALLRRLLWARRGHGYALMVPPESVRIDEL